MTLKPEQINYVRIQIERSAVTIPTLQDDLIDHLCCAIEGRMDEGKSFDDAMQEVIREFAPDVLEEIQRETDFLLHLKHKIPMKRITYLIGLLSTMAMSFGWLLRIMRMGEVGNAVFAFGALGFVTLFLPMLAINYFKDNVSKSWAEKLRFVSGILSGIIIGIAFLLKIMHMPGADEVMWLGGGFFTFAFLPFLFFTMYKKSMG